MRKKVIKFFSLDYRVFIFGRQISWTRSANVIFPLMLLSGFLTINNNSLSYCLIPIAYCLFAIALFFGFIYFKIKPLKQVDYDYFDEAQRSIWDYYQNGSVGEIKNYTPQWVFWVNPVLFVLFLIFYLCN